ncbi:MAG: hypothetical protein K2W99_06420 [Chthoniobacterales bacterium]|nr:hypothetical protein [Chthoniobacterales bacterium]
MRKLPLLLLLSALVLASVDVSAMMERKDPKKEESNKQEILEYSKEREEKDLIKNVGSSCGGTTEALWKSEGSSISPEESTSPKSEKEDLSDLGILDQRIKEAEKVIADLNGKEPAMEEVVLLSLYQKWSNRYERYKEKEDVFGRANNIGTIEQQLLEGKLGELVEASFQAAQMLQKSLEDLMARHNVKKSEENMLRARSAEMDHSLLQEQFLFRDTKAIGHAEQAARTASEALLPYALTLEHFRYAVANHPLAARFVLKKEKGHSVIQLQEALNPTFKNENRKILKKLRVLISTNYSTPIAESLSSLTLFSIKKGAALSAERIRNIIHSAELLGFLKNSPDSKKFKKLKGCMESALESVVRNTKSNRKIIVQRALAKAEETGASEAALKKLPQFLDQSSDFKNWLKAKGPCLRAIPPSLVEEEMRYPGTTSIEVVKSQSGVVVTVYRKEDIFDRENESAQKGSEGSLYFFDWSHPFVLEEGVDGEKYLEPRGRTIYHNISYTEHALERMALDTPSNRKRITDRFIEKAKTPKQEERKLSQDELEALQIFFEQPVAFQEWWKKNDPRLQEDFSFSMEGEEYPFGVSNEVLLIDKHFKDLNGYEVTNDFPYLVEKSAYLLRGAKEFLFLEMIPSLKENGFPHIADLWTRLALQWQAAVNNLREAIEARTSGTEEEFANAYELTKAASWSASCLEGAAKALEQSEEAKQNNNQSLALLCEKCAQEYQQLLTGYEKKVAAASLLQHASRVDRYNDINNWAERRSDSLKQIATTLQKALQATLDGNHSFSGRLETIAAQWQMALKYESMAVKADNLGDKERRKDFKRVMGLAMQSAILLHQALPREQQLYDYRKQKLKRKNHLNPQQKQLVGEDYQKAVEAWDLRENKEESTLCEQAAEAERRDNSSLATIWRQSAEQSRTATEFERQAAEASAAGNEEENSRFRQLFITAQKNAAELKKEATILEALEKADEAERDKNPLLANLWRQFFEQIKIADDYCEQAKRARVEGNRNIIWDKVAHSARAVVYWLKEATSSLEKAQAAKNENYLTFKFWEKVGQQNKKCADDQQRVTAGYTLGEKEKLKYWDEINELLTESSDQRHNAITAFEEYSEAIQNSDQMRAHLWHQSSEQRYHAAEQYGKAINASFKENPTLANLWKEAAEQNKTTALCYQEAVEAPSRLQREALHQAADRLMSSADHLKNAVTSFEKASQVEASSNQALAILLQKSSEQYQLAARCLSRSAQAIILKYTCLKHPLEAAFWENRESSYKSASTLYQQAAEAYAQKNKIVGARLNQEAIAIEEAAKALQDPKKEARAL